MRNIVADDAANREEWDGFIKSHEEANFLQSWDFYEFHESRGKKVTRRLFKEDDKIVAAYAGVVETAKRGTYMAIAGGPIMDYKDKSLVKTVFENNKKMCHISSCAYMRVHPQLTLSDKSVKLMKE